MTAVTLASINARAATIELVDDNQKYVYRSLVRPEVAKFAIEMETVLRENDHKSGWDKMTVDDLFFRMRDEFNELKQAFNNCIESCVDSKEEDDALQHIRKEAIDIANFCMFLCHNYPETEAK